MPHDAGGNDTQCHILHAPKFPLLGESTAKSAAAHPREEPEAAENTNFQSKYLLEITVSWEKREYNEEGELNFCLIELRTYKPFGRDQRHSRVFFKTG